MFSLRCMIQSEVNEVLFVNGSPIKKVGTDEFIQRCIQILADPCYISSPTIPHFSCCPTNPPHCRRAASLLAAAACPAPQPRRRATTGKCRWAGVDESGCLFEKIGECETWLLLVCVV